MKIQNVLTCNDQRTMIVCSQCCIWPAKEDMENNNHFRDKKAAKNKAHKRYENKKTKKTRMYIFYTQLSQRIFRLTFMLAFMYEMIVV